MPGWETHRGSVRSAGIYLFPFMIDVGSDLDQVSRYSLDLDILKCIALSGI